METLPIQFVLRQQGSVRQQIQLDCRPEESIRTVKERLARQIGMEAAQLRMIFCGRALPDEMALSLLALSPATAIFVTTTLPSLPSSNSSSIHPIWQIIGVSGDAKDEMDWVKVDAQGEELTPETEDPSQDPDPELGQFSTFHVFCKSCAHLQRAKLRAHCRHCGCSAIIFKQEPQRWADVAENNQISVDCHHCDAERGVLFRFKCIECNEVASPLRHIRRCSHSALSADCVICGSSSSPLGLRLPGCSHFTCLPCFIAYGNQLLSRMALSWRPQVGYTIGCPAFGCQAFVSDVHTLYLLGIPAYNRYQQMAAQLYFSAQIAERQYCPWPNCGASFFVEEEEDDREKEERKMLLCPECSRLFCRRCCATDGTCKCVDKFSEPDESASLIQRTTKNCPNCAAPTERAGGCAHIHCTQCQTQWCFICLKVWSDNCQWDHWFE